MNCICGHQTTTHAAGTGKCRMCPCFKYRPVARPTSNDAFDEEAAAAIELYNLPTVTNKVQ